LEPEKKIGDAELCDRRPRARNRVPL